MKHKTAYETKSAGKEPACRKQAPASFHPSELSGDEEKALTVLYEFIRNIPHRVFLQDILEAGLQIGDDRHILRLLNILEQRHQIRHLVHGTKDVYLSRLYLRRLYDPSCQ